MNESKYNSKNYVHISRCNQNDVLRQLSGLGILWSQKPGIAGVDQTWKNETGVVFAYSCEGELDMAEIQFYLLLGIWKISS